MKITNDEITELLIVFRKCNFNDVQCKQLIWQYSYYASKKKNLERKIERYKNVIMSWGYSETEAIDIIVQSPRYINNTEEWLNANKDIVLKERKNRTNLVIKSIEEMNVNDINSSSLMEAFLEFGFTKKQVQFFKESSRSAILLLSTKDFYDRVNFFIKYGYTKEEIIRFTVDEPSFLLYDEGSFQDKFNYFAKLDITPMEFMTMYKRNFHGLRCDISRMKYVIDWFFEYGFSKENIKKIIIKQPSIFNASNNVIYTEKYNNLLRFGFTKEQVVLMITKCPTYLSNSSLKANDKLELLLNCEFTKEEVISIVCGYPEYITMSVENITDKIDALADARVLDSLINKPKNLMQSAHLTIIRSYYLLEHIKMPINDRYRYLMFICKEYFNNYFHLEDGELDRIYNERETVLKTLNYQ